MALVPGIVARNWRLKLAAFGLTVVLWAVVRTESGGQGNLFTVPVQAQVGDLAWTLAGDPDPATVQVRFRGPTEDLIRLAREGTTLRIPLDSVARGDTLVQLRRDWVVVGGDSRLVVEEIAPASVHLTLEKTVTRVVPVRVVTAGELPEGLALAAPIGLNPQMVGLRGSAQRVRAVTSASLAPLDLGGVRESGIYPIAVDTVGLGGVTPDPATIDLRIRLEPLLERQLTGVPVVPGEGPDGHSLTDSVTLVPSAILVRIQGARTVVNGTRAEEVQAVVPWETVAALAPGQEMRLAIRLRGLPALVRGFAEVDSVTVRRTARAAAAATVER